PHRALHPVPTRRSSDLQKEVARRHTATKSPRPLATSPHRVNNHSQAQKDNEKQHARLQNFHMTALIKPIPCLYTAHHHVINKRLDRKSTRLNSSPVKTS